MPAYTGGSSMKDDRAAKLYAGQMGIAAVRAVTHFNEVLGQSDGRYGTRDQGQPEGRAPTCSRRADDARGHLRRV